MALSVKLYTFFITIHCITYVAPENCYPRNECDSGYMDRTNGNYYWWECGEDCEGGKHYTDIWCTCACIPVAKCSITSIQSVNCNLSIVDYGDIISCSIPVNYETIYENQKKRSSVISSIFNLTNQNSYCNKPMISYNYSKYNEGIIWIYEGKPLPEQKIASCSGHSTTNDCNHMDQCLKNTTLTNYYANSTFIDVTTFVSKQVEVNCSTSNSELILTCERQRKVVCDEKQFCHDMNITVDDAVSLYLQCHGKHSCTRINIHGGNATQIIIECLGDYSCSKFIINSVNVEIFTLYCHNGINKTVCDTFYIDINYVDVANIICTQYGCSNINIHAMHAINIAIHADGHNAFINSTIYSQNANQLSLSCIAKDLTERTCLDANIYLSHISMSNSLICRFGCTSLNLYFQKHIDVSLFNEFLFQECALCEHINDCIDEWIIYYDNYNSSIIYKGKHDIGLAAEFTAYIDQQHKCVSDAILKTELLDLVGIIFCTIYSIIFSAFFILMIKNVSIRIYYKISYKYISNKPKLWILLYAIIVDIVCVMSYIWWGIKITVMHSYSSSYCASKYKYEADKHFCSNDNMCIVENDKCTFRDTSILVTYWILFGVYFLYEFQRILCGKTSKSDIIKCRKYIKLNIAEYSKRELWISKRNGYAASIYIYLQFTFIRYSIINILMWIVVTSSHFDTNWYDFYILFSLICIKVLLILNYSFGKPYDEKQHTQLILVDIFGQHIASIIKSYTPMFYDELHCAIELGTVTQKDSELNTLINMQIN
eukprot:519413_1